MFITITLTDDQALEIVSQIASKLSKKTVRPARSLAQVVGDMSKGDMFFTSVVAAELGIDMKTMSNEVQSLKRHGLVEVVKRGSWRKL